MNVSIEYIPQYVPTDHNGDPYLKTIKGKTFVKVFYSCNARSYTAASGLVEVWVEMPASGESGGNWYLRDIRDVAPESP